MKHWTTWTRYDTGRAVISGCFALLLFSLNVPFWSWTMLGAILLLVLMSMVGYAEGRAEANE